MILFPQAYRFKGATIHRTKDSTAEHTNAAAIIRLILNAHAITDDDVRPELANLTWGGELTDNDVLDISCMQMYHQRTYA